MDGFDQTVNVKVIMATNRADTLDPALLRPGRLDRKIEFPLPDRRQKRLVFQVYTCASKPLTLNNLSINRKSLWMLVICICKISSIKAQWYLHPTALCCLLHLCSEHRVLKNSRSCPKNPTCRWKSAGNHLSDRHAQRCNYSWWLAHGQKVHLKQIW